MKTILEILFSSIKGLLIIFLIVILITPKLPLIILLIIANAGGSKKALKIYEKIAFWPLDKFIESIT